MKMLSFILFFSSILYSQDEEFSINQIKVDQNSEIIDLSKSNIDEKTKFFQSIMRKTNKMIFYFSDYGIEVYQIVAIEEDSLKLELFDSSWFNKSTKLNSYGSAGSKPLFFTSNYNENKKHSQVETVSLNNIMAIKVKENNSFRFLIYPIIIAVVLIELLTII